MKKSANLPKRKLTFGFLRPWQHLSPRNAPSDSEKESSRRLDRLQALALQLSSSADLPQILDTIAEATMGLLNGSQSRIFLLEPGTDRLVCRASCGIPASTGDAPAELRLGVGLGGEIAASGKPSISADIQKDSNWLNVEWAKRFDFHSFIGAPFLSSGKVLGLISCLSTRIDQFQERDLRLLESLAAQAAIAIENGRVLEELQVRSERQEVLRKIIQKLTQNLEPATLFSDLCESVCQLLDVDFTRFLVLDERTEAFTEMGISGRFEDLEGYIMTIPKGKGIVSRVFEEKKPIVVPEVSKDPDWFDYEWAEKTGVQSYVGIPLTLDEEVVGLLNAFSVRKREFQPDEIEFLKMFADQAVAALDNARLYQEAHNRATDLEVLDEIGKAINSTLSMGELVEVVGDQMKRVVSCDQCSLYVVDTLELAFADVYFAETKNVEKRLEWMNYNRRILGSHWEGVLQTKKYLYTPDIQTETGSRRRFLDEIGLRSVLNIPIVNNEKCIGLLNVSSKEVNAFTDGDINLLCAVADHLAIAMKNAELYANARESNERLTSFILGSPDGIITADLDGRITSWNPGAKQIYGYSAEEVLGKELFQVFSGKGRPTRELWKKVLSGELVPPWEVVRRRKDGMLVWVSITFSAVKDSSGRIVGISGINRDITAQKRAEEALQGSETRLRAVVETAIDAIITIDEGGIVESFNPAAERMFGYTAEEVINRNVSMLMPSPYTEQHDDYLCHYLATGERKVIGIGREVTGRRKDGTTFPLYVGVSEFTVGGKPMFTGITRDLSERKRLEEQLRQTQKLEAVGELASGVAHSINNVLGGILTRTEVAKIRNAGSEVEKDLDLIKKSALQGAKVVKRLQSFARKREERPKGIVSLNHSLNEAAEMTRPRWKSGSEKKGIQVELDVEALAAPDTIQGDEAELQEVLVNLIHNALDAMLEGGRITLSTKNVENSVILTVSDTGKGMSPGVRERAFEPFFTTKGEQGTGLGLSSIYGIVDRHGGRIALESAPGQGTTVEITFPVSSKEGTVFKEDGEISSPPPSRILIIDDDVEVVEAVGELLRLTGHQVTVSKDPRDGLRRYGNAEFDLVITDLGMSEMNGWEVAQRVKQMDAAAPVIMLTGWGNEISEGELAKKGVSLLLVKPVEEKSLLKAIGEVISSV